MLGGVFKRTIRNLRRSPGKYLLLGFAVFVIAVLIITGLSIKSGATQSINDARQSLGNEVTLQTNSQGNQRDVINNKNAGVAKVTPDPITVTLANKFLYLPHVIDHEYTSRIRLTSDIKPVQATEPTSTNQPDMNDNTRKIIKNPDLKSQDFTMIGTSRALAKMNDFANGTKVLKDGRLYIDTDIQSKAKVAVIDELLAINNDLKIGNMFKAKDSAGKNEIEFTIIGIYTDTAQADMFAPFAALIPANTFYVPYTTIQGFSALSLGTDANALASATYYIDDPSNIPAFKTAATAAGLDTTKHIMKSNDKQYLQMVGPLQKLSDFSGAALIAILIAGGLIIILLMTLTTRDRKLEIGVLRSLGASKKNVIIQFAAETMIACLLAIMLGGFVGSVVSQSAGNYLLNREITTTQQAQNDRGFGGPGGGNIQKIRQRMNKSPQKISVISTVNTIIGQKEVLQLLGAGLFLCLCGCLVSTIKITRYEPIQILASRN